MFEENDGAFASGDRGILFLAIESPGQAAITEITKERLDGGINRGSYSIADIPTDRGADFVNDLADLTEYSFDRVGNKEESGDFAETAFDFLKAFGKRAFW